MGMGRDTAGMVTTRGRDARKRMNLGAIHDFNPLAQCSPFRGGSCSEDNELPTIDLSKSPELRGADKELPTIDLSSIMSLLPKETSLHAGGKAVTKEYDATCKSSMPSSSAKLLGANEKGCSHAHASELPVQHLLLHQQLSAESALRYTHTGLPCAVSSTTEDHPYIHISSTHACENR